MKLNRILNTDVFLKDKNTPRITRLHKFNYLDENMRLGVDICELSEVIWDGQKHFTILNGYTIVYSNRHTRHVGSDSLISQENHCSACQQLLFLKLTH